VKRGVPVLVIVGNPPYDRTSHNANPHSDSLLEDFYTLNGVRLPERNSGPLRDDYLRFIRWSVWKLLEQEGSPGHGVLAFVSNRAFIERKLHRAVRHFLLRKFDEIRVFDLHGDQREWFSGRTDEKVFKDVQAGIALTIFIKSPNATRENLASVHYRETFGSVPQT
jgi:predicted helicase